MHGRSTFAGRFLTGLFLLGIVLSAAWIGWVRYGEVFRGLTRIGEVDREMDRLQRRLAENVLDRRVVDIFVRSSRISDDTGRVTLTLEWRERRPMKDGTSAGDWFDAIVFDVQGIEPRFEALMMRFKGDSPHPLRDRSLIFFRRVYGEYTAPENAFSFADPENPAPLPYRTDTNLPAAERRLWTDLWHIATDPAAVGRRDVESVQTKAVAVELIAGRLYTLVADRRGTLDLQGPFAPSPVFLAEPMPLKVVR